MIKSMQVCLLLTLTAALVTIDAPTAEAQYYSYGVARPVWMPFGGIFRPRLRQAYYGNTTAYYGGTTTYYGGTGYYGANNCCATTTNYAPYTASYGIMNGCGTCNGCSTGCNSCNNCCGYSGSGCATGNCGTLIPATGTTPTPTSNAQPTPTTTFSSSKATLNEDAIENNSNSNDNNNSGFETFEPPVKSDSGASSAPSFNPNYNETSSSNSSAPSSASPFGNNNTTNESLKVPATPSTPVEQKQPEPAPVDIDGTQLNLPPLRLEPAPIANISMTHKPAASRVNRTASYETTVVAREVQDVPVWAFLPPLPAPIQVAGN